MLTTFGLEVAPERLPGPYQVQGRLGKIRLLRSINLRPGQLVGSKVPRLDQGVVVFVNGSSPMTWRDGLQGRKRRGVTPKSRVGANCRALARPVGSSFAKSAESTCEADWAVVITSLQRLEIT